MIIVRFAPMFGLARYPALMASAFVTPPKTFSASSLCYRASIYGFCGSQRQKSSTGLPQLKLGQDSSELFDVYLPPSKLEVLVEPPVPAGFSKARALVHTDGDWHRSVHIWLVNDKGELVLQKRSATKDTFPDMWDVSVGGHFTSGDSSLETAMKETEEELGLTCRAEQFNFVCTVATTASGSTVMHGDFLCNEYKDIYLLQYNGEIKDLKFSPDEVSDVKWVGMETLEQKLLAEDPAYIPRPKHYIEALFAKLRKEIKEI